jgi:hypothetical protein
MKFKYLAACGAAACCLSTVALAQASTAPDPATSQGSSQEAPMNVATPAPQVSVAGALAQRMLAAGTIVVVTPMQEISSKHVAVGDHFQFQVVNDVVENGVVVIPRGSIATGTITFKTGRAIGGKSGKFEVSFESVSANGRQFPLTGVHRQEGRGNTVGALLGSILISGRSAVMLQGQMVNALIKEPTPY